MVSNTLFVLVAVALTAYLVDCSIIGIGGEKCKPKKEALQKSFPMIMECCKQATGKTCDQKTLKEDMAELTETEEGEMCKCIALKQGVVTADGQFDSEKAKAGLDMLDIDAETRTALENNVDECVKDNAGDNDAIRKCARNGTQKICSA